MTAGRDGALDTPRLLTLYHLGKLVTASLDIDATLGAIVEAANRLTGAESTAILLLDGDELEIRVGLGSVKAAVGERVQASEGVVGRALGAGRAILVPDMRAEADRARPDLDLRFGTRSFIAAPLVWHGERLGVVTASATSEDAWGADEASLIEELADQAAAAIAHARAYQEEQWLRAESQAIVHQLAEQTRQLELAQRQLVQNEKLTAIGELAHGIAHELNTPLGVVVSNLSVLERYAASLSEVARAAEEAVELLRDESGRERGAELLQRSLQAEDVEYILEDLPQLIAESTASAERMAALIRSVATFAQKDPDQFATVDVEGALESALTLAWNRLKHVGQVVRHFSGVPVVRGRASELTQVFVHLLLNAAQALAEQPGAVTVATETAGDEVVVTIADSGVGIPEADLPRVFDPFFTTRPPGQGSGMGLAVCHGIVTRHGGTIQIDSARGRGTTVNVRLPVARGLAEAA